MKVIKKKLNNIYYLQQTFFLVVTTEGNANGKPCIFPFTYNNVLHYQCTYEDSQAFNNQRWCRTNDNSSPTLEWGNCPSKVKF